MIVLIWLSSILSSTVVRINILDVQGKHDITGGCFNQKLEIYRPCFDINLLKRSKLHRNIVVQAELAGTGSPHTAPLTGFNGTPSRFSFSPLLLLPFVILIFLLIGRTSIVLKS